MVVGRVNINVLNFNAINTKIIRNLVGGHRLVTSHLNISLILHNVKSLSVAASHNIGISPTVLHASTVRIVGSPSISVMIRLVKNYNVTGGLIITTLRTNGPIIATGGGLLTRYNGRVFTLTTRGGISVCFNTSINNNVPVVHILHRNLVNGTVGRVCNVLGNAYGCVLAEVRGRNGPFSRVLTSTRHLNCTRTGPSLSVSNFSATRGTLVLTTLSCNIRLPVSSVRIRNVHNLGNYSIGCTHSLKCGVGLVTAVTHRNSSIRIFITPALIPRGRVLTSISNIFGTTVIGNSVSSGALCCNHNTNHTPATDAMINSVTSMTHGLTSNRIHRPRIVPATSLGLHLHPTSRVGRTFCVHLGIIRAPNSLNEFAAVLNGRGIDVSTIVRRRTSSGSPTIPIIVLARVTHRTSIGTTLRRVRTSNMVARTPVDFHVVKR